MVWQNGEADMAKENIITEYDLAQRYDDMLDDCYGTVTIAGHEYETSRALKEADPIAYRVGMHDYADHLLKDDDTLGIEGYE